MKQECSHRCIKAYTFIQGTLLISTIKDFGFIAKGEVNSQTLQQFYEYLKLKHKIPCETGMLFIEKVTTMNIFEKFKAKSGHINGIVNKKMMLCRWIKPSHLEIRELDFGDVVEGLKGIGTTGVPSVKIYHLIESIRILYGKLGKDTGHDGLFPCLVYCFIKSEIQDLYVHVSLMKTCRRKFDQDCGFGCNHGFQVSVSCDCLFSKDWGNEDEYYITVSQAAVEYISKIEFCGLSIGMVEFDREIAKRLNSIDLKGKEDGSVGTE